MSQPTSFTSTSSFAQQTAINGQGQIPGSTPPLLPAFLITGLLLAAIVFIIVWRHLIERRNAQREDDPTWPVEGIGNSGTSPKGPKPKLWDLEVKSESARATWQEIMPLSAAPLRAKPKPRRPRYLIPSDRPISFLTRMFGGERRPPQPPMHTSTLAPTHPPRPLGLPPGNAEDEDPIDRLQVAVLISFPHPRRVRRTSYLPEKAKESIDTPSLPPEKSSLRSVGEGSELEDHDGASPPHKGKKRSLDTPVFHGYDPKAYYDYDDEEGPVEVAFGTVILPFEEQDS